MSEAPACTHAHEELHPDFLPGEVEAGQGSRVELKGQAGG